MEDNIRQVIVMRRFKNLRIGKYIAQGSHGSIAFLTNALKEKRELTEVEQSWVDNSFTKICVYVETDEELDTLYKQAKEAGLNAYLIVDNGLTEFKGIKTKTCLTIGPDYKSKLDPITGHLPLF
jgi:PTH2 family peptidyl-tRNA hydrolase